MKVIVDDMAVIRVALVDHHALLRELLATCLREQDGFQIAWTTHCPMEAQGLLALDAPDVLLVDVESHLRNSFDLVRKITAARGKTRAVILTNNECDSVVSLSLDASGYIVKDDSFENLVSGIRQIVDGTVYFSERIGNRLRFDLAEEKHTVAQPHCLNKCTPHQLQLLTHLARGDSAKEIAKLMHISVKAVNSIKYRVMRRLGIHDRVQLARLAIREGLISP